MIYNLGLIYLNKYLNNKDFLRMGGGYCPDLENTNLFGWIQAKHAYGKWFRGLFLILM